jgi:hypothetical protein
MDSRLIFLHKLERSYTSGRWPEGEHPVRWVSRKSEDVYDSEVLGRTVEKSRRGTNQLPVLKLTQVGEKNILRRSRERW